MAPWRSGNRLSPAHQNTWPRHSEVINLHFKFFFCWDKKSFYCTLRVSASTVAFLRVLSSHCCDMSYQVDAAGVQKHQIVWSVMPATCSITRWLLEETIKAPSSLLMVSAPHFLISMVFFIHRLYLWVSDAIIAEFFHSFMWFSCLQWSEMANFKFSWSLCFTTPSTGMKELLCLHTPGTLSSSDQLSMEDVADVTDHMINPSCRLRPETPDYKTRHSSARTTLRGRRQRTPKNVRKEKLKT